MKENYILITTAKNEEKYIENTIKSVISQVVAPKSWVIIDDGSDDSTPDIVANYQKNYPFILFIKNAKKHGRNFASQANLINMGYNEIKNLDFDFIGTLDADITFESDYYLNIMNEFDKNPNLGLAGGSFFENYDGNWKRIQVVDHSVRGGVQFFRKECFKAIGEKLIPLKYGGFDSVAEVLSRKNGWQVKTFSEYTVYHHRPTGTVGVGVYKARFRSGLSDYYIGTHPIYHIIKCIKRSIENPYLLGSLFRITGFVLGSLKKEDMQLDQDFIHYHRREQLHRLKTHLLKKSS